MTSRSLGSWSGRSARADALHIALLVAAATLIAGCGHLGRLQYGTHTVSPVRADSTAGEREAASRETGGLRPMFGDTLIGLMPGTGDSTRRYLGRLRDGYTSDTLNIMVFGDNRPGLRTSRLYPQIVTIKQMFSPNPLRIARGLIAIPWAIVRGLVPDLALVRDVPAIMAHMPKWGREHQVMNAMMAKIDSLHARGHSVTAVVNTGDLVEDGRYPAQWKRFLRITEPLRARSALTLAWVDARIASGTPENLVLAARALGAMSGSARTARLRALLTNDDIEVKRAALLSSTRRPARELLDVLLALLAVPGLNYAARETLAAVGDPAVPALRRMLGRPEYRAQSLAAGALARIATRHAVDALVTRVRSSDLGERHVGLRGLARIRLRTGRPVLPRHMAHRLFLRELRDYRANLDPATALGSHPSPEVRLLADSYRESAEMALERGLQALGCWYESRPLIGVFDRLKSSDREIASPALEFLEHVLPRKVFGPVRKIFEEPPVVPGEQEAGGDPFAVWIERAWKSEDGWLRACAVRASRFLPGFEGALFASGDGGDPLVRAELQFLDDRGVAIPAPALAAGAKGTPC